MSCKCKNTQTSVIGIDGYSIVANPPPFQRGGINYYFIFSLGLLFLIVFLLLIKK